MTAMEAAVPGRFIVQSCCLFAPGIIVFISSGCRKPVFEETDLFTNGANGYDTYRIPSLITTKSGTLLAFCEGRKNSQEDSGHSAFPFLIEDLNKN